MPFTPTPDATVSEIFENLPFVAGRLRLVQDELVRRLQNRLPAAIAELNERNGWTDLAAKAIPVPALIGLAPTVLTDEYLNSVLVGVSLQSSAHGVGAFRNEVQVEVFSIDSRLVTPQQIRVQWERAELIRGVLFPFLTGCVNPDGKRCWRQLEPTSIEMLPDDWGANFSGSVCRFVAIQAPANDEIWE
jgi:hypothetical protein